MIDVNFFRRIFKYLQKITDNSTEDELLKHIIRHSKEEFEKKLFEGRIDDWFDSQLNLFFMYRMKQGKDIIDWENMYKRLKHHERIEGSIKEDN